MLVYKTRTTSLLITYDSLEGGFPIKKCSLEAASHEGLCNLPAHLRSNPKGTHAGFAADGGLKRGRGNILAGHKSSQGF